MTQERKPFFAHARNLKRYYSQEGVDPVQIALMDKNEYLLEKIIDYKCTHSDIKDKNNYVFIVLFKGYPDEAHWMTYQEMQNEAVFLEWCYGGFRPLTIGWISMKTKELHPELLRRLNLQESARTAKEKPERNKMKAYKAKNEETVSSEPVIKAKSNRRRIKYAHRLNRRRKKM